MILRRFGKKLQSVAIDFNSRAMNELGFRPDHSLAIDADEFAASYKEVEVHKLTAEGEGDVKIEVEQAVLDAVRAKLEKLDRELGTDGVLVVENEAGKDYPRMHDVTSTIVVGNENRLHFRYTVDPPLRVSVHRTQ
jgi:hypothetical protein